MEDIEDLVKVRKANVISASRRNDIMPHFGEFLLALHNGSIQVPNPVTHAKSIVSLAPEDVKVIVFWSKDYAQFVTAYSTDPDAKLLLDKYKLAFQFTINDEAHSLLEPGVCHSLDERLEQAKFVVDNFGVESLHWRFDPIVFFEKVSDRSDPKLAGTKYLNNVYFEKIATYMAMLGVKEVKMAFCYNYPKVVAKMLKYGIVYVPLTLELKQQILDMFILPITNKLGISVEMCSDPDMLNLKGISISSCISAARLSKLGDGVELDKKSYRKDPGQKRHGKTGGEEHGECHCTTSIDIGSYSPCCKHSCVYCYSSPAPSPFIVPLEYVPFRDLLASITKKLEELSMRQ